MIIDTSALLAILYVEDDAERYAAAIAAASLCRMSAANFLEAAINIDSRGDAEASRQLDNFVRHAAIEIAEITLHQVQIARQAYQDFGKGRHTAALNFGDCFAYALARDKNEPLLFKGNDFIHTDIAICEI
ncbi:MAG: type II toxin-antitoxin system VapC family toxin [Caldilineaceae bacterium]|nr:type II toxin-antitoxin system VapC family toxin [Caldilineaceae bacterium]MCB0127068.1 type II toxin-antitoxin system VapC family toxin [Caldilineaceae bacterium]MCB0183063.1 type II toxin-antitoxin system VapC family toxin [Caldilineaceae bacterium]